MKRWIIYAFISMACAGFTSVIARPGLSGISGVLGLAARTCFVFVFVFVLMFAAATVPSPELASLDLRNVDWLALSAVSTAGSWIFYYKAIKLGDVSTVTPIDKGSVVVAALLSFRILQEAATMPKLVGAALIVAGLPVMARG